MSIFPQDVRPIPYWRLSAFYFFNCAVLGSMLPYWMLFMQSLGYSAWQIGQLTALQMVTTIAAPYLWGEICDRLPSRMRVIQVGNLIAVISFAVAFFCFHSYWALVALLCVSAFCWQGLNAQFELITLNHLSDRPERYGRIRLWGSGGFLTAVWAVGQIVERYSVDSLPYIVLGLLCVLWLVTLMNQGQPPGSDHDGANKTSAGFWKRPVLWSLILVFFLANFSHGSYYGFYSLLLKEQGIGAAVTGNLWTVGVASEIAVFALMPWLMRHFSLRTLLLLSLGLTTLRWLGMASQSGSVAELTLLQLLHGVSFSAVHTVAVLLFRQVASSQHQGKAQALYSAVCIGAGQASGVALGGHLWSYSSSLAFYFSALAALASLVAGFALLRKNT